MAFLIGAVFVRTRHRGLPAFVRLFEPGQSYDSIGPLESAGRLAQRDGQLRRRAGHGAVAEERTADV
jgi:hypothetical protein